MMTPHKSVPAHEIDRLMHAFNKGTITAGQSEVLWTFMGTYISVRFNRVKLSLTHEAKEEMLSNIMCHVIRQLRIKDTAMMTSPLAYITQCIEREIPKQTNRYMKHHKRKVEMLHLVDDVAHMLVIPGRSV